MSHSHACLPLGERAEAPASSPSGTSMEVAGDAGGPEAPLGDSGLLLRARGGDPAARDDLARRSGAVAFRFALQLVGDRELARDVAQDSVLRLFASLDRVDAGRPLQPWLLSIVRNRVVDLRRRDRARGERALLAPVEPMVDDRDRAHDPPDASPGPLERSEQGELQRLMWSCLGRLDRPHREILVLRDYQDLSYREIAEVLGVPLGTVMSRLHAARRKLRAEVLATGFRFGGAS